MIFRYRTDYVQDDHAQWREEFGRPLNIFRNKILGGWDLRRHFSSLGEKSEKNYCKHFSGLCGRRSLSVSFQEFVP